MANQFLIYAKEVLATASTPLTFTEIWEAGEESGVSKKLRTNGKTPWNSLGAQLFVDVRDNPNSDFIKVGSRPGRFFLKSRKSEIKNKSIGKIEEEEISKIKEKGKYNERDLHAVLSYYANSNPAFNRGKRILTKTIFHEKSKKSGYSEWVYPDLVGFFLPIEDWNVEIIELNRISGNNALRLYSFELKKSLNRANYRESYFQSVSNSSWAHEGYLVTANFTEDEDLLSELERLNQSFGIGIIELNLEDIDSSRILFPAKSKTNLDWETMNKLADSNEDFRKFIQDVKIDLESKRIHLSEYDKVEEDIEKYIKKISK
jgi:uncharacterized protein